MWGSCGATRLLIPQKLQTHGARLEKKSSYDAPADALIEKINWPTIAEIIKRERESGHGLQVFKWSRTNVETLPEALSI